MLLIRPEQLRVLDLACFEAYAEWLTEKVSGDRFLGARRQFLTDPASRDETRKLVTRMIDRARKLGFICEGDVTPFVVLCLVEQEMRDMGLWDWITAILHGTDHSPEARMDAVYALLPERERKLCFFEPPPPTINRHDRQLIWLAF